MKRTIYFSGCCGECGGAVSAKGPKGNPGATGPAGAAGATGATGPAGATPPIVLSNNMTPVSTVLNAFTTLMSYNLPANKLLTNGDIVEITAVLDIENADIGTKQVRVSIGGSVCHTSLSSFDTILGQGYMTLQVLVNRSAVGATFVECKVFIASGKFVGMTSYFCYDPFALDMTIARLIEIQAKTSSASSYIRARNLVVKYYNKV